MYLEKLTENTKPIIVKTQDDEIKIGISCGISSFSYDVYNKIKLFQV